MKAEGVSLLRLLLPDIQLMVGWQGSETSWNPVSGPGEAIFPGSTARCHVYQQTGWPKACRQPQWEEKLSGCQEGHPLSSPGGLQVGNTRIAHGPPVGKVLCRFPPRQAGIWEHPGSPGHSWGSPGHSWGNPGHWWGSPVCVSAFRRHLISHTAPRRCFPFPSSQVHLFALQIQLLCLQPIPGFLKFLYYTDFDLVVRCVGDYCKNLANTWAPAICT